LTRHAALTQIKDAEPARPAMSIRRLIGPNCIGVLVPAAKLNARNCATVDSRMHLPRFDCYKIKFHSVRSTTLQHNPPKPAVHCTAA
jgi:hypothetical protein